MDFKIWNRFGMYWSLCLRCFHRWIFLDWVGAWGYESEPGLVLIAFQILVGTAFRNPYGLPVTHFQPPHAHALPPSAVAPHTHWHTKFMNVHAYIILKTFGSFWHNAEKYFSVTVFFKLTKFIWAPWCDLPLGVSCPLGWVTLTNSRKGQAPTKLIVAADEF